MSHIFKKFCEDISVKNGIEIRLDVSKMLQNEFNSGVFNRADIVVRILAAENYFGKNDWGFKLYNKMQEIRVATNKKVSKKKRNNQEKFIELIKSFKKNGYDSRYPIIVNKNLELIDGSHRLALAILFNINNIPIITNENHFFENVTYDISWFKKNGFSGKDIQKITKRMKEIFIEKGEYSYGIIWGPAYHKKKEILDYVSEHSIIFQYKDIKFKSYDGFRRFVKEVYNKDIISEERLEKKIMSMKKNYNNCCFFESFFLYPYDTLIWKEHLVTTKSKIIKEIKTNIRYSFVNNKNYYFDNVFHFGDTKNENNYLRKLYKSIII